ncbi:Hypothetical protein R9X50_00057200 [Acrodontium crateriforme]|uniref:Uncharacterized protein n=1 Tax=Acrodontium crateriforme TaxID=150365 RepID=A0AAQ3LXH2_9PEZI|nr:Hypothetical protein R9X50_00057200 [Acrodontium crateriforme]
MSVFTAFSIFHTAHDLSGEAIFSVRGKRHGSKAEKWNTGKRRGVSRNGSSKSTRSSTAPSVASSRTKELVSRTQLRRNRELSRLEELPAEIIQAMFEFSANPSLALVSPILAKQLSSHHVYHQITTRVLSPVLGHKDTRANETELSAAIRLLNSKFMTWTFFRSWVDQQVLKLNINRNEINRVDEYDDDNLRHRRLWSLLQPSPGLVPPAKLLRGPWSTGKVRFLNVFAPAIENIMEANPVLGEVAYEGLAHAVAQQSLPAVRALTGMGLRVTTELVQQAVIDDGCDHLIVLHLFHSAGTDHESVGTASSDIDYLDPGLWSWADRARANGDSKGEWLMDLLRALARYGSKGSKCCGINSTS